ncbi:hypothetical protein [Thermodesulfovibrio yellowstonii]|uniref:Uncharacterized protein n=1 Tax=Thermodesulfovibrio yellowstonii TaxID=28262 RepID=A0A9W6GEM8_9BACT|nr:hypothetical protein [Thermodesulfovibrio islandicus]GLI52417.1 hypothetical protein TISLANDTSLP1_01100 [Thermodesulfovibrio islandicus]
MGAISRDNKDENKKLFIYQIYKALRKGGFLVFAENLEGSIFHMLGRKYFVKWGKSWNYLKYDEIHELFKCFSEFHFKTYGFLGAFGRNEKQREILGILDRFIVKLTLSKWHYIIFGVAKK